MIPPRRHGVESVAPPRASDVAYTPPSVARALVQTIAPEVCGRVAWEPYVGRRAFADALGEAGASPVLMTDCDPRVAGSVAAEPFARVPYDVVHGLPAWWPRPDVIATNPPFSLLDEHLPILFDTARELVALLLVGQCLAPRCRDWLWDLAVPDWSLWVRERIPFEGGEWGEGDTDAREYAWMVWRRRAGSWMGRGRLGRVSVVSGQVWMGVDHAEAA